MKIALGIVLGVTLLIVGCVAVIGAGSSSVQNEIDKTTSASTADGSASKAAAPAGKAKNFATGDAQGDFAIAQASGTVDNPGQLRVKVSAAPNQKGSVSWNVVCTKGTGSGSKDGQFEATTPIKRTLPTPQDNPDSCVVSANVQLATGGTVKIALAG